MVKEACLSVACLAQELGPRSESLLAPLLAPLLELQQGSASRVASSSARVTIRFLLHHCYCPGWLSELCRATASASCSLRRCTFQFLEQVLHVWPLHLLASQTTHLGEAVVGGMADPDPSVRAAARQAYWAFGDELRLEVEELLGSVEGRAASPGRSSRQSSVGRSQESLQEGTTLGRRGSLRVRRSQEMGGTSLRR